MTRNLLLLALAVGLACGGAEDASEPAVEAEHEGPTEVEMVAAMEAHYAAAILAHDALIQGDLEIFRARLAELDSQSLPANSPDAWRPLDAQLHSAAARARDVNELGAGASTMAAVAFACGACHQSTSSGPVYPAPPPGEDTGHTRAEMRKHKRAALMLWNGVTGPSEYGWREGAEGLAGTRIFGTSESRGETDPSLLTREATLRGLGEEAKTVAALADRAALYGRLLATCGDCHQAVGIKITR